VAKSDPVEDYKKAVERLASLQPRIAAQESLDEVGEAVTQLRLAVTRAFGGQRPRKPPGHGASKCILEYLLEHLGEWVYGDELAAVSGIREWARRVRELRVESGYEIEERNGEYRLTRRDPNLARRDRWKTISDLRGAVGTPEERVRSLFERMVGQIVSIDEIDRVARGRHGARVVRHLRSYEGWPIESEADSPKLASGEFRLASVVDTYLLPEGQSIFAEDLRRQVFRRDSYTCWDCRQSAETAAGSPQTPFYLVIRHLDAAPANLHGLAAQTLTDRSRLATSCIDCMMKRQGLCS
jgi:hypothetical protein